MKSFILSLAIAAAIVISSLLYSNHMENISMELLEKNQRIVNCIEVEDYPSAAELAEELESYIESKRSFLAATIDHSKLDNIDVYISQMKKYVQTGQKADSLSNCQVLEVLMTRLPRDYKLKFENIL